MIPHVLETSENSNHLFYKCTSNDLLFVGDNDSNLYQALLSSTGESATKLSIFDPDVFEVKVPKKQIGQFMMQRYNLIEKIKEAACIGVLVGTVSTNNYAQIMKLISKHIRQAGKKSYEVMVGKINEPKLLNF